eukprot:gene17118-23420_t
MAKLALHPVGLALIFFGLLSWVVALGGIAASTKYCHDNNSISFCSQQYQLEWWSIWFEFFLLLIMLATCFLAAFERARFIYLTYLTLVTCLLTVTVRNFITNSFATQGGTFDIKDYKQSAYNAAAAGGIMLCITNYALIIFVGLGASAAQQAHAYATPEQRYAPSSF